MKNRERGDTIIEVLFGVTVFSLVAVGGLSLMNQGTAIAQRALEIGLVRQQMDTQADALRYLNSLYVEDFTNPSSTAVSVWKKVTAPDHVVQQAQSFDGVGSNGVCNNVPSKAFALNVAKLGDALDPAKSAASIDDLLLSPTNDTVIYAKVEPDATPPDAQGIWVEAVQDTSNPQQNGSNPRFYDFHITACWSSPGQQAPVKLGTIVRLYEPKV